VTTDSSDAKVLADARNGIFQVRRERLAGDRLDGLDVALHRLDLHVVRDRGDGAVSAEPALDEPPSDVLLVEALRVLAARDAVRVRVLEPEPERVGRVDLVDDDDAAVLRLPELVLRVDEDEPALRAEVLPEREELHRHLRRRVEIRGGHLADLEDL